MGVEPKDCDDNVPDLYIVIMLYTVLIYFLFLVVCLMQSNKTFN